MTKEDPSNHELLARLIEAIERLDRSAAAVREVILEIRGILPKQRDPTP